MGFIYHGVPKELVIALQKAGNYPCFVETGTFLGNTIIWAAGYFKQAYTIEINEAMSMSASKRPDASPTIKFLVGNSATILKTLADELPAKVMFWLDGHYSGEGTGGEDNECPLMGELEAISKKQSSIILIDDLRFFLGPPPAGHRSKDWPGINEIILKLNALFPKHYITMLDDIIIACPNEYRSVLDTNWQQNFSKRYPVATGGPAYKKWFSKK